MNNGQQNDFVGSGPVIIPGLYNGRNKTFFLFGRKSSNKFIVFKYFFELLICSFIKRDHIFTVYICSSC